MYMTPGEMAMFRLQQGLDPGYGGDFGGPTQPLQSYESPWTPKHDNYTMGCNNSEFNSNYGYGSPDPFAGATLKIDIPETPSYDYLKTEPLIPKTLGSVYDTPGSQDLPEYGIPNYVKGVREAIEQDRIIIEMGTRDLFKPKPAQYIDKF